MLLSYKLPQEGERLSSWWLQTLTKSLHKPVVHVSYKKSIATSFDGGEEDSSNQYLCGVMKRLRGNVQISYLDPFLCIVSSEVVFSNGESGDPHRLPPFSKPGLVFGHRKLLGRLVQLIFRRGTRGLGYQQARSYSAERRVRARGSEDGKMNIPVSE